MRKKSINIGIKFPVNYFRVLATFVIELNSDYTPSLLLVTTIYSRMFQAYSWHVTSVTQHIQS